MTEIHPSSKNKSRESFQQPWKILNTHSMGGLDMATAKIFVLSLLLAALQLTWCQIACVGPFCPSMERMGSLAHPRALNRSGSRGRAQGPSRNSAASILMSKAPAIVNSLQQQRLPRAA